eukprot:SAG31_NODE_7172_length_1767_cov_1.668465_1_plen_589_part_11
MWRSANAAANWTRIVINNINRSTNAGSMIQLSAEHPTHPGRLIAVRKGPGAVGQKSALTSLSDSLGATWQDSATEQADMDESELIELDDGAVAMVSRNWLNCSSIPPDAPCREHQDGPCMCTAVATSIDGGERFDKPSMPIPSLKGANCRGAVLTIGNQTFFSGPTYVGPPRLPNPPHAPCGYDPVSKRTGHCYTDRAPNRINGTIMVASGSSSASVLGEWRVHTRVTIGTWCSTEAQCAESAGFGYSSMSALPASLWPNHFAIAYETTSPDCGYDPMQRTATGMGSATSACKIVLAVVPIKTDDTNNDDSRPMDSASPFQKSSTPTFAFRPGQPMFDISGKQIDAHGGGFLHDGGTYFWYGSARRNHTDAGCTTLPRHACDKGINLYSSQDLYRWRFESTVVTPVMTSENGLDLERPKVLRCGVGKYVMWLRGTPIYSGNELKVGVLKSPTPRGPWQWAASNRTDPFKLVGGKYQFGDATLFQDPGSGRSYAFWRARTPQDGFRAMELADDCMDVRPETDTQLFRSPNREAPAFFSYAKNYYLWTSGTLGWTPVQAYVYKASAPLGPFNTSLGHGWHAYIKPLNFSNA